jgi:2-hydroxy-3-oxopropionate reductase
MSETMHTPRPRIGLIGTGAMGGPMGARLLAAGWPLTVHARRRPGADALLAAGAQWAASPRELAACCEIVLTVVCEASDVEQVLFGANGVLEGARAGTLVIDLSTISAQAARGFAQRLGEHGVGMLDAPVIGDAVGASDGSLSMPVGGPDVLLERARPLLQVLARSVVHVGEHGAGQVAKSCNQIVAAVSIEAVAEALTLARRLGADPRRVQAALAGGFAASRVLDAHGARMIERRFEPGLHAALHAKDLGIVVDSAHALGLDLPAAALAAQQLNALVGAGEGSLDSSAMIKVLERMMGEQR